MMKEVVKEIKEGNLSHRQRLYKVVSKFINVSEVSAQKAVYILLDMSLSICSRSSIFINTGEPHERVRRLKSEKDLLDMDPDSTDVMMSGVLEYYAARPASLKEMSLAEFAAMYNYFKRPNSSTSFKDNEDCEETPEETKGETLVLKHNMGYIRKRTIERIIRFRRYNPEKVRKNFMRERLMLCIPWRDETQDLIQIDTEWKFATNLDRIRAVESVFIFNASDDYEDIEKYLEKEAREELLETIDDPVAEEFRIYDLLFDNKLFQESI